MSQQQPLPGLSATAPASESTVSALFPPISAITASAPLPVAAPSVPNASSSLPLEYSLPKSTTARTASVAERLPGFPSALAAATQPGGIGFSGRGNGLDYAVMRKEKAREEYKEKRRRQLLENGEFDRTKRRKKNDTSMTEYQKYHRRLKMNQDSAAAARHAQEVYIQTLENLVEVTESEKSVLSIQALNLKTERDDLMRQVHQLQQQLNVAQAGRPTPTATNNSTGDSNSAVPVHTSQSEATHKVAAQAQLDLKTVFELMDPSGHSVPTEFRSLNAVHPPRAV